MILSQSVLYVVIHLSKCLSSCFTRHAGYNHLCLSVHLLIRFPMAKAFPTTSSEFNLTMIILALAPKNIGFAAVCKNVYYC